jgi:Protein of unknown function (DUF433)
MTSHVLSRDSDVMGGAVVFSGTRVPVQTLLDYSRPAIPSTTFLRAFRQSRANKSSPSWSRQKTGLSNPSREGVPRRVRRLAIISRTPGTPRSNGPTDGMDVHQERRTASLVSAEFDTFVTVDRNLTFQQSISSLPISVVVIRAKTNRLGDLLPLVPDLLSAIETTSAREVKFVGSP